MAKSSYNNANVDITSGGDTFGGWINKTNQVINDMATTVLTAGSVAQPNSTNGASVTGNTHIEGILSSTTVAVVNNLRGGTVSSPGALTISSNTILNGSITNFNSNVAFNAKISTNIIPVANNILSIGNSTSSFGQSYFSDLIVSANVQSDLFISKGNTPRSFKSLSTTTGYQNMQIVLRTSTGFEKTPAIFSSTSVSPGANATFDLGSSLTMWKTGFLKDVSVSNQISSNSITSNNAIFNSTIDTSLTPSQIVYSSTGGKLVDSTNLTFDGSTVLVPNISASANVDVGVAINTVNIDASGDTILSGNLTVLGTTTLSSNTNFSINTFISTASTVNSLLQINGNTIAGFSSSNTIKLIASVDSSIIPVANTLYNIGSSTNLFNNIWATNLHGSLSYSSLTGLPNPNIVVSLSGDIVGSANTTLTNLGNGSVNVISTIQPNSVALGVDTVGNFVSTASGGNGINITGSGTEIADIIISHSDTSAVANVSINNTGGIVLQDVYANFDIFGHVQSFSSLSTNLDGRYPTVAFKTISSNNGQIIANTKTNTFSIMGGSSTLTSANSSTGIVTVNSTDTLDSVSSRGASTLNNLSVGNLNANNGILAGNLTISGGLNLNGISPINVAGNNIILNSNLTGIPTLNAGIEINRGTSSNVRLIWNETTNYWTVGSSNFQAGVFIGSLNGNATSATKLQTARTISLSGEATGSVSFNGTSAVSIPVALNASSILTKIKTVDGSGSGLDADLLDGQHGAYYLPASSYTPSAFATALQGTNGQTAYGWGNHALAGYAPKATPAFTGNMTVAGTITAGGDITAFSDERLKTNIKTIDSALDKVMRLHGVSFDKDGHSSIGVIAQEVEKIIPEVVYINNDEMKTKSVAYGNLVGLLIEAIKELKDTIDDITV